MDNRCPKCQAPTTPDNKFCAICGTPLPTQPLPTPPQQYAPQPQQYAPPPQQYAPPPQYQQPQPQYAPQPQYGIPPQQAKRSKTAVICIIAVVVVALLVVFFVSSSDKDSGGSGSSNGGSSNSVADYEQPIKYLFDGLNGYNWNTFSKALPPTLIEEIDNRGVSHSEVIEAMFSNLFDEHDTVEKLSYKVVGKTRFSDDDLYDYSDDLEVDLTDGYELEVEYSATVDGEKEVDTEEFYVGKINGKWYFLDF
ncbi:MAG: zinc ribbon domain-containing protein [Oscillospiraceae bacterium]|jgi:hypothetical protein|nr:zinc ribbon domain-containing protein [Oscillospiraceae bacterium]